MKAEKTELKRSDRGRRKRKHGKSGIIGKGTKKTKLIK
jgi:hypothetical protein